MKTSERVFQIVKKIPKGKLTTYSSLAKKAHTSPRAIGRILNSNKNLVVIPCHRVVKSDGTIGGYSKGIKIKIKLLKKEGISVKKGRIMGFSEKACF